MGIAEVLTAPQNPWQNAYAERSIGSIRRECPNHFIILNARHLKRTLAAYFRYRSRPRLALEKQCPIERRVMQNGAIIAVAELDGLHHRYERISPEGDRENTQTNEDHAGRLCGIASRGAGNEGDGRTFQQSDG
jgi:transposase InsO family protein